VGIKIERIALMRAFGGRRIFHEDENDFIHVYESREGRSYLAQR
jgi:hypothetical protein